MCNSADKGLIDWVAGQPLPVPAFETHLAAPIKRFAQRVLHGGIVQLMDSHRDGWESEDAMQPIPPDKQLMLRRLLRCSGAHLDTRRESGSLPEGTL